MIRIAIVEDEDMYVQQFTGYLKEYQKTCEEELNVTIYRDGDGIVEHYKAQFDIILMDIQMRFMDGMSAAEEIRKVDSEVVIMFITNMTQYAIRGYEVDALHYLVKPVSREKLFEVLSRAAGKLAVEPPFVVISCQGGRVKLYESDILYVESFLHDIVIHTKTGEYRIKENISAFAQRLSKDFFRVHRSYLVNLKAVIRIGRTSVTLESGAEVPVARGKYDNINRAFIARN